MITKKIYVMVIFISLSNGLSIPDYMSVNIKGAAAKKQI